MNTLIKNTTERPGKHSGFRLIPAIIALASLALLSKALAVVPAPDGGYPGFNTAEGTNALKNLTTGMGDTAAGWYSLFSNTEGSLNTAVGAGTLVLNVGAQGAIDGTENTAVGATALLNNTFGHDNTATGTSALFSNTEGVQNTANGDYALYSNTIGSGNTAVGAPALLNSTGNFNTAVGQSAGSAVTTASNVICIGSSGANVDHSCFIDNIRGVTTVNNNAMPVLVDSAGQLGTASSSRRYKTDIKPIAKASESILALKPVSFRYRVHKDNTPQFGLIAEEVAEVNPNLVIYDADGKPYTVRYDAVNAMLLNEFLKEHKKVEEQQATIAELKSTVAQQQKGMEALTARLNEQASQIQRVSAQMEAGRPPTKVVVNNP